MNGSSGFTWYLPSTIRMSGKLTPEARTPMRTWPGPSVGLAASPTSSASISPSERQRSARMILLLLECSDAQFPSRPRLHVAGRHGAAARAAAACPWRFAATPRTGTAGPAPCSSTGACGNGRAAPALRGRGAGPGDHVGDDDLAPSGIVDARHPREPHARVLLQHLLHLGRRNVDPRALDHLGVAPHEHDGAVRPQQAEVAGREIAVRRERLGGVSRARAGIARASDSL